MGDIDETSRNYLNSYTPVFEHPDENPAWRCCHESGPGVRNLVVCIDRIENQFGRENTNVVELYHLIRKEVGSNQLTWYNSGIGTYARPSWRSLEYYRQVIDHRIDLAIGWNFGRSILAAYRWLSDNYQEGDRIFLFGLSRGAFQVRALAAMIDKVGLIHKGNEEQIPFAYALYADPESGVAHNGISMAKRFKATFSQENADVHYVGVWDMVSSIGIARGKYLLPGTVDGMKHVCYFRHALALDERRVKFAPEVAYRGSTTGPPESNVSPTNGKSQPQQSSNPDAPPQTLEVWFPRTHSDIGGGNVADEDMKRNRLALHWMVFESGAAGLRTKPFKCAAAPSDSSHTDLATILQSSNHSSTTTSTVLSWETAHTRISSLSGMAESNLATTPRYSNPSSTTISTVLSQTTAYSHASSSTYCSDYGLFYTRRAFEDQ